MKPAKKSYLLLFLFLALGLAALFGPGCGNSTETGPAADATPSTEAVAETPGHAKLLPDSAWLVMTVRPGQLMQKLEYSDFIHMPAILQSYSLAEQLNIDLDDQEEVAEAAYATTLIEDPAASGIAIDRDSYFFLGTPGKPSPDISFPMPALPSFGFVLPMGDREKFENLVEFLLVSSREDDDVRRSSKGGTRYVEHQNWLLAITDEVAFLQGALPGNELDVGKIKRGLASSNGPPAYLAAMLQRPFDLALHLNFEGMLNILKPIISAGADGELDALLASPAMGWMKGGSESIEFSAENGRFVLTERATLGKDFKYDLVGPQVSDPMLDLLPAESIAAASVSLNMEGIRQMLLDMQKAVGDDLWSSNDLDLPPLDATIPELGLSIDEALSAFSGQITAALVDLPDPDAPSPQSDVPEFVLAFSTVDPASKVYQDILKKKLLALFDKGIRGELKKEAGISLVAKDNRLILGSSGQAALLKAGKAPKPVGGDVRTFLTDGYLNLDLDFAKLAQALPIDRQRPSEEDEITLDALDRLERLTLQAKKKGRLYEASVALSLDDKKTNALHQVGTLVANWMDPAYRDPEIRPRIEAARKLAAKNPDEFGKGLVGNWQLEEKGEDPDAPKPISRFLGKADSTYLYQSIAIETKGYHFDEMKGRWANYGSTMITRDEHGLIDWFGGVLSVGEEKLVYYNFLTEEFQEFPNLNDFELYSNQRMPDDWRLPDPPKGLPKLEEPIYEGDGPVGEENGTQF